MITNLIVILTIVFALAYFIVWFLHRDLRTKIESPKHDFQSHLRQFDKECQHGKNKEGEIDAQA